MPCLSFLAIGLNDPLNYLSTPLTNRISRWKTWERRIEAENCRERLIRTVDSGNHIRKYDNFIKRMNGGNGLFTS